MLIIGVDPGQKGGIAYWNGVEMSAMPMPLAGKEIDIETLAGATKAKLPVNHLGVQGINLFGVVEKVHSMPKQGVSSSMKFGKNYGIILGVLGALRIPVQLVTPQAWKKEILAGSKKDKDAAIEYVRLKYPNVRLIPPGCRKPHDGIADAVCICEMGVKLQPRIKEIKREDLR